MSMPTKESCSLCGLGRELGWGKPVREEGNGGWRRRGDGTGDTGHRHAWEPGVGDGAGEDTERTGMRRSCLTAEQRISAAISKHV